MKRFILVSVILIAVFVVFNNSQTVHILADQTAEEKAISIYKRLTSTGISVDAPIIQDMIAKINGGKPKEAAQMVTSQSPGFYNLVVRDMFTRMSARDELVSNPLSDFVATGVGIVRDGIDARQMLTGNFTYQAAAGTQKVGGGAVRSAIVADMLKSNNHYIDLAGVDLKAALVKVEGQLLLPTANSTTPVAHPDPAGVLTSRKWMLEHAIAGTNRRLVEYTFREFLCTPMEVWADSNNPDSYVGIDVERVPEGDPNVFKNKCNACHSGMDALRPAYGKVSFSGTDNNGFALYGDVTADDVSTTTTNGFPSPNGDKYTYNTFIAIKVIPSYKNNVFPDGYKPQDTTFQNMAVRPGNWEYFGWDPGTLQGTGMGDLGKMVGAAKQFRRCMAKRVFRETCKRDPAVEEKPLIDELATSFAASNYNLKDLFEEVVILPSCVGN